MLPIRPGSTHPYSQQLFLRLNHSLYKVEQRRVVPLTLLAPATSLFISLASVQFGQLKGPLLLLLQIKRRP